MATIADLITKVGSPGTATTLASPGHTIGGLTLNVGSTSNWPAVGELAIFAIDEVTIVNGEEVETPGTYRECVGIVQDATTISSLAFVIGADRNYPAASTTRVYIPVTSTWHNRIAQALMAHTNQDGTLKTSAVQAALNLGSGSLTGWNPLGYTFAYGANNGQKEFTVTTANDLSAVLTPGMRFKIQRGTTALTQCMAFVSASSQYAQKSSPTGISFTDDFTCEAWIFVTNHTNATQTIISRMDSGDANGFYLDLDSSGRLRLIGKNAGASNFRYISSYQSVPSNRWVHVAATLDMSGWTTATNKTYFNGRDTPAFLTSSGSNPTSLVQAGNLAIGNYTSATNYFNGYIAEARIWSAVRSAAQIKDNMGITLVGNETNIVALFKGSGNFTDSTINANTLTAVNTAIATQASNPYHDTEYAIITKVSYSNPTTTVTLFTGTDYVIPNMTLSTPQYATDGNPLGWPDSNKWIVDSWFMSNQSVAFGALNTWTPAGGEIAVPTGTWKLGYEGVFGLSSTVSGTKSGWFQLASSSPTNSIYGVPLISRVLCYSTTLFYQSLQRSHEVTLSSQTAYLMYSSIDVAPGVDSFTIAGAQGLVVYKAQNAYA